MNWAIFFGFIEISSEYELFILEVALDATCAAGEPADQCTDSNAECTSTTCSCKATHFKDNGDVCQTRKFF